MRKPTVTIGPFRMFRKVSDKLFFVMLTKAPVRTDTFSYESACFSPHLGLPSTRKRRFRSPKMVTFENALQSGASRKRRLDGEKNPKTGVKNDISTSVALDSNARSVDRQWGIRIVVTCTYGRDNQ